MRQALAVSCRSDHVHAETPEPGGPLAAAIYKVAAIRNELHRLTGNLSSHANVVFGPRPPSAIDTPKGNPIPGGSLGELADEIGMLEVSLPELENEIARFSSLALPG